MKVIVYNDRDLNVIEEYSTQNENDFEVMEFKFSSLFDNYNKKIVFLTPDGNISYYINNNKFLIPREITQYEQVKFYIWCTFEDKDFRTKLKILSFYKNENVNIDILPLEKAQIEQIINELEKNILIVQNLEKQTTNLINTVQTKLDNGDFKGDKGDKGDPGESYDDTEIKEEISDIKEEQTTQNTDIEALQSQVQELESNQLTGTSTGQSIYIEDSINTKVRDIGLSGNSEQESTTGKNKFDFKKASNIENTEITEYRIFEISGLKANQQYNINNMKFNAGLGNKYCYLWNAKTYSSTNKYEIAGTTNYNNKVDFNANNEGKIYLAIYPTDTTTWENIISYLEKAQIEEGSTATSYEPYTGGQASPNPSYPQEIHSTGDSGSVNEKVQNKNLFDIKKWVLQGNNPNYYSYENGKLYINAVDTRTVEGFTEADRIYLPNGDYYLSNIGSASIRIYNNDTNNNVSTNQFTVTLGYIYLKLVSYNVMSCTPMIEQGSTATDYAPHEEQNISFPLAQGQKLMQGDYLADDGIHHVRGEAVFNGTEAWEYAFNTCVRIIKSDVKIATSMSDLENIKCTHLKTYSQNAVQNGVVDYGISTRSGSTPGICIRNKDYISLAEYKSWLAEQYTNGTPVKVQYELAEEVIEAYTEEQQAVWEQIKALRTYKPITHISSTDEVPATVDVTYVKDLETVINNLRGA